MIYVIAYITAMVLANLSIAYFGPFVSPINSFLFIGLDLSLRDKLHDRWQGDKLWQRMFAMILISGAISFALNPAAGRIAIASAIAFMLSAFVDFLVYQKLKNKDYFIRSNGSNVFGALADSLVFPTIAFGSVLPTIVAMQFAAKVSGGAIWTWVLRKFIQIK